MKKSYLFALTILLICHSAIGQESNKNTFQLNKIDSLFSTIGKDNKHMASISIFSEGVEIYQKSTGFADIESNIVADHETKYRIGSITKTFTAVIMLQLINEGKLSLQTTLSDYFPSISNSNKITIANLLKHRSGIFDLTESEDFNSWMEDYKSQEELLAIIASKESQFEPDSKTQYSNSNYILLSLIAEKIEQKTYNQILDSRILKPCGLTNTYHGRKISSKNKEAFSYVMENDWKKATETDLSIPLGAGALVSTPSELNHFYYCLFNEDLLSRPSIELMTQITDGWGMGLSKFPLPQLTAFGHPGSIDGFRSVSIYFPADKIGISYIANGETIPMQQLIFGVVKTLFGFPQ